MQYGQRRLPNLNTKAKSRKRMKRGKTRNKRVFQKKEEGSNSPEIRKNMLITHLSSHVFNQTELKFRYTRVKGINQNIPIKLRDQEIGH